MVTNGAGLDFIVIGAQKAGTTSLFQYLRAHPQIALPEDKERPFFSHDAAYRRGFDEYVKALALSAAGPEIRRGTVTPQYMAGAVFAAEGEPSGPSEEPPERAVPARIARTLPGVRLIAILRDPVERAVSHHRMEQRRAREQRPLEQAIAEQLEPVALESARHLPREETGYVVRGEYARILGGYLQELPREQLLVLFTTDLEARPAEVLRRVHEFIGVDPGQVPENLGVRYGVNEFTARASIANPSSWVGPAGPLNPQRLQRRLWRSDAASRAWRLLPERRREAIAARYAGLNRAAARRQTAARFEQQAAPAEQQPALDGATLQRLREHYAADGAALAGLAGVQPPWLQAA